MLFSDQNMGALRRQTYGQELILDIHEVPAEFFESKRIKQFSEDLCDEIKMKRGPNYVWGNDASLRTMHNPKADGISCIQFLYTSSITIHAIDELQKVFVNIFSCHDFDADVAKNFVLSNTGGQLVSFTNLKRK